MKLMLLFTRKPEVSPEEFREYYETKHAPLSLKLLPFFKTYKRNYVRRDLSYDPGTEGSTNSGPDFDVATEITFETRADYDRMMQAFGDPEIMSQIIADEENFIDRSCLQMFFVDEEETPEEKLREFAS